MSISIEAARQKRIAERVLGMLDKTGVSAERLAEQTAVMQKLIRYYETGEIEEPGEKVEGVTVGRVLKIRRVPR